MTLSVLLARLQGCLFEGASPDSPITVEFYLDGYNEDENDLIQSEIESVTVERRCEDDHEPTGVYLNLPDRS